MRYACDCVDGLVWSTVGQSVKAFDAIVKQAGTHVVDRFSVELENEYASSRLTCLYMLTRMSSVGGLMSSYRVLFLTEEEVEVLLLRIRRRVFRLNRQHLLRRSFVVAPRRFIDGMFLRI